MTEKSKDKKPLNSVALLFFFIIVAALLTYIIPAGEYVRVMQNGKNVVDPNSFSFVESGNVSLFDIFLAVPSGMSNAITLIIGALLIGGGLEVIQASGAINIGIARSIQKIGVARGDIVLIFLFYVFAVMGGFLGFVEGSIPFIPIAISIAIGLGYDSLVGVAIAIVGAISGFTCGPTNPYTVGVAQTISGMKMYSGLNLRVVMFVIVPLISLMYILRYAKKVRNSSSHSMVVDIDASDLKFNIDEFASQPFTLAHGLTLLVLVGGMCFYVYGSVSWGWNFYHLGAIFLIAGIAAGIFSRFSVNKITETFINGASGMTGACFVMGVAYAIAWILTKGKVLDTIVYYLSEPLKGLPAIVTVIGMLIIILIINLFIPSGSGKALIMMPIIFPIAQIVGIENQVAILAYQFGDGITNMCTPLLGVLLLALGFGKVPFAKWEKFIMPLVGILFVLACVFLFVAISIGYC